MMRLCWISLMLLLAGCAGRAPAPVVERGGPTTVVERGAGAAGVAPVPAAGAAAAAAVPAGYYVVKKGDTLFRIAHDHGQDPKEVAAWNSLENSARIEVGQQLRVAPPESVAVVKPVALPGAVVLVPEGQPAVAAKSGDLVKHDPRGGKVAYSDQALAQVKAMEGGAAAEPAAAKPAEQPAVPVPPPVAATGDDALNWMWPVSGKVLTQFVEGGAGKESNKGVDIGARLGEPVLAAAGGKIVYVGSGLRGYGNLVIVRHNATYLSAYAHNSKILVKEGQTVNRAQKIAEAGNSDADQPKLHFEIRRLGKPVDPLKYLPAR
jgi:lipoprotein NlpD